MMVVVPTLALAGADSVDSLLAEPRVTNMVLVDSILQAPATELESVPGWLPTRELE